MDNQHKLIKGYRDLDKDEIDLINKIKNLEILCMELIETLKLNHADARNITIAKTNIEQGFMWLIKSIAKPSNP